MKGWIKSIRQSKGLIFLSITDGAKDHQITIKEDCSVIGVFKVGASFIATGVDSVTPKGQPEFLASTITIIGTSDDEYPIQSKYHSDEFLRTIPELRGRARAFQATWKIRHHLTQAIHRTLEDFGFYQYYTPIITHADCEGAGDTFSVKSEWLDEKLTVSGQLHGEVGMMSLGKIYTFSPCFRAEKSMTKKHLSEFWMIEPEIAFFDLKQTVEFTEKFIKDVFVYVLSKSEYEFKQLGIDDSHIKSLLSIDWKVISYKEICEKFGLEFGLDISSELEKKIVDFYKSPVFITHYQKDLKPFYMKKDSDVAYCFDLIFPEVGEVVGGSQREESYDILKDSIEKSGIDLEKMKWYLSTRKWGSVPHSGFGLGFERLLMYIVKAQKIHDVIPFPVSY